jgi:DNA-binding NarL/FixJ family response regulator
MPRRWGASTLVETAKRSDAQSVTTSTDTVVHNEARMTAPVRVLIVDDQAPFRMAARMVVEATDGFEVAGEVETGEASVDAAHELDPDLVLMDVNLPGIDGLEATRRILAASTRVVILLLSTYEEAEYAPRAAECGAAAYIPKSSFGPDRLTEAWTEAAGG